MSAMTANGKRVLTTRPRSRGLPNLSVCVMAEMMATSETGARLSPKMAPERMAPAISGTSQPSAAPKGKKMGDAARIVEMELPVAVAKSDEMRKTAGVSSGVPAMAPPVKAARASASPAAFIMAEKTPAAIKRSSTVAVMGDAAPSKTAFQ